MRRHRLGLLALLLLSLSGATTAQAAPDTSPIQVCFDESERSPLLHADADGRWRGATLELVERALQRIGLQPRWRPLPWGRCLQEAKQFDPARGHTIEMLFYASRNAERERDFLISQPLHRVHGGAWYSRQKFAQAPALARVADLRAYRLCGLLNSNYSWLRAEGVPRIDVGAPNLQAALRNLQLGRCDFVLSTFEQVRGSELLGQLEPDEHRAFLPYPGRGPVEQHLMLSRRSPRGEQLLRQLNRALDELQKDGSRDAIYQRYLGAAAKPPPSASPR